MPISAIRGLPRIVVIGGGAGGLQLATFLGDALGKHRQAEIVLVDCRLSHLWKPLLHEVAAGTLDSQDADLDYLAQARWHHFSFRLGRLDGLDRAQKRISLAAVSDGSGEQIAPASTLTYDCLVIAIGSVSNDFGVPGVKEYCHYLDNADEADQFHAQLLRKMLFAYTSQDGAATGELSVAIVGAGATGVEFAAELRSAGKVFAAYGLNDENKAGEFRLTLIGASPRILPGLPERLSRMAHEELERLNVEVLTNERVVAATEDGLQTLDGRFIRAQFKVWAGGIKAPEVLSRLDGLECNRINQLRVKPTLQTLQDNDVFAFGDCAECPQPDSADPVPPRAQAAHQQAAFLASALHRWLANEPLEPFVYRDYGSMISLGQRATVGNLMGKLTGGLFFEGKIARLMYVGLYRLHQRALFGTARMLVSALGHWLSRRTEARLKLH